MTQVPTIDACAAQLRQVLGNEHVHDDAPTRQFFSTDIFYVGEPCALVIAPGNTDELGAAVAAATSAGLAVVPRGGGMSYTRGYLGGPRSVLVDTRRMDHVLEINTHDLFVTVECGISWEALDAALKPHGVRTPFWGTGSGKYATVGGTVSQNAINYGSGRYGPSVDSVLGLTVVVADGSTLTTGSAATPFAPSPFFRTYGPDLTGLFLADTGALGIKATATLKLIPRAPAIEYASFEFADAAALCGAMSALARHALTSECSGYDALLMAYMIRKQSFGDDIRKLGQVVRSGQNLFEGVRDAAKVAMAGRHAFRNVAYSIHYTVDGRNATEAVGKMAQAKAICGAAGEEIDASVPRLVRAGPFPSPTLLFNKDGKQWIPVHAIVPHSRALAFVGAVEAYFQTHQAVLDKNAIEWGNFIVPASAQALRIEPCLFFPDAPNALRRSFFDADYLSGIAEHDRDQDVHDAVRDLRQGIAALAKDFGAVHFQIGRQYPYRETRDAKTYALLRAVKAAVDPRGLMNPGVLGLD
ncbi:MAG: FAD-binding oxidoreductase [Proteobacteria bacterium]|nr:FAD-binding oxidoreductase [Pseudomonadota bacterium]MDA1057068.1 FAD-binding oxidoreductase [Pseudomonadota bacterium]